MALAFDLRMASITVGSVREDSKGSSSTEVGSRKFQGRATERRKDFHNAQSLHLDQVKKKIMIAV